jgi:hypothetical protein
MVRSITPLGPGNLRDGQARLLEGGHVAAVLKLRASGNASVRLSAARQSPSGASRPVSAERDPPQRAPALPSPVRELQSALNAELRETHISWVLLAGKAAYKLKKPVRLAFVDYGTLDRRRALCHEEVRLNRRLAPDVSPVVAARQVHYQERKIQPDVLLAQPGVERDAVDDLNAALEHDVLGPQVAVTVANEPGPGPSEKLLAPAPL